MAKFKLFILQGIDDPDARGTQSRGDGCQLGNDQRYDQADDQPVCGKGECKLVARYGGHSDEQYPDEDDTRCQPKDANGFWTATPSYQLFLSSSVPSKKNVFGPSTLFSLDEACYLDWRTFGMPKIWLAHLSMKKPLFFRGFL